MSHAMLWKRCKIQYLREKISQSFVWKQLCFFQDDIALNIDDLVDTVLAGGCASICECSRPNTRSCFNGTMLCMIQCDNNSLCAMQWSMFHIQPWWKFTQISKHRIELFLSCRVADTASSSTWPVIGNKLDLGSILDIYTVSVWSQSYKERLSNWLWHVKFARELLWFTWKLTIYCVYWYIWKWVHIKWRQASITK